MGCISQSLLQLAVAMWPSSAQWITAVFPKWHLLLSLLLIIFSCLSTLESPIFYYINSYVTMWYAYRCTFQVQFSIESRTKFLEVYKGWMFLLEVTMVVLNLIDDQFLVPPAWRSKGNVLKLNHWECASCSSKIVTSFIFFIPTFKIILVSLDLRHLTLRCI